MSNTVVNIVIPLFGIMLLGYLFGRFGLLKQQASEALSGFVFYVSMPALIFIKLSTISVSDFFDWTFIAVLGGGMLITFFIGFIASKIFFAGSLTENGLHALCSMYSSTAYIGLPIVLLLFGDAGLAPGIVGAVITGVVFMPLAVILIELGRGRETNRGAMQSLFSAMKNPILIATICGLLISAADFRIPSPAATFFTTLGGAFVPCALFSAGLFMVRCSVKGAALEISWLVIIKLLIHPLITWWLAFHVFELDGVLPMIAVILAALPSGVPVFVLAQQYQCFESRSGAAIVISTAISLISISVLLLVFGF